MIRNFNPSTSQPNHNHAQSQMSVAGPSSGMVSGNGTVTVPGGSAGHELPVNPASKVAEVFLTAGHAFQKLGDLTLQLHCNSSERDESKWCEADVDALRNALTRFAHELDTISESVQSRTTKHIKTDIKRRTLLGDDMTGGGGGGGMGGSAVARRAHSPAVSTLQVAGKRPAPSSLSSGPVMQKRIATGTTTIAKGYAPARQVVGYSSAGPSGGHMMHSGGGGGGAGHSGGHVLNPNNISLSSGGGSAQPTPLLADPSHHYISARMPDIGPSTF